MEERIHRLFRVDKYRVKNVFVKRLRDLGNEVHVGRNTVRVDNVLHRFLTHQEAGALTRQRKIARQRFPRKTWLHGPAQP